MRWQAVPSLVPLALLLAACGSAPPQARPPLVVQTTLVDAARFAPVIETISTIESTSNVVMRPESDGRVVRILARDGQRVRAGQPILVLDNVQEAATLDSNRAQALKDRVNAERYIFLNEQGAVSTKDRDYYVTQAIQSRDAARSSAATLGYKFVTAPIDGEIGNLDSVKLGDYVRQGQAITGIVNNSTLWTLMDVPATQSSQVRIGQPVELESQGNPPVKGMGKVVFVSPYFASTTSSSSMPNTVLVKAVFPNLTGVLKTGQFVRNRIVTGSREQLAVPVEAVMMQAQQPFVYRVVSLSTILPKIRASDQLPAEEKQKLEKLPGTTPVVMQTAVKLGKLQNNFYPVLSGLERGDEVVVSNTALLRSGMPVKRATAAKASCAKMTFSDNFIKRPVLTTVCSILIVLVGLIAIPTLSIENLPNIAPPLIQVTANYGGANSLVTEQAVTNPIEQQINGVPGASYISSTSTMSGTSTIQVYFDQGTDINIDQVNVQNRVSLAMPQLPQQVQATGVSVMQSTPSILLAYQVTSTQGQFDSFYLNGLIYQNLYYQLERVPGVASVSLLGGSNPAFWLFVDADKLAANNLTAEDVVNAVGNQNSVAIGGLVGGPPAGGNQKFAYPILVENNGNLVSVEELNSLIVGRSPSGNLLRLRDVGSATYGVNSFAQQAVSIDGFPSITVAVFQTPESNALDVSNQVVAVMNQFTQTVPPGVKVLQIYNIGQFIESAVEGVVDALGLAIVLVLLILFLFLQDWRATVVPSLAIPISLVGTFAFVKVFGFSINQLTLLGLVLATGLVVDDAIVVIEAVEKNLEKGMRPRQAALACMGELFGALVATALVLMAVFVPVAFYPGGIGIIYRQFALTIAFSIAISAFNALTFSPMLSALLLRSRKSPPPGRVVGIIGGVLLGLAFGRFSSASFGPITYAVGVTAGVLAGANLAWIFARFNAFFARLERTYASLVGALIARRRLILAGLGGGILLTLYAFSALPTAFIPVEDQGYGLGIIQLQNGASLSQTQATAQEVAEVLRQEPEILAASVVSGYGFNGASPDQGAFFYGFKPLEERSGPDQKAPAIVSRLNAKLSRISSGMAVAAQPPAVPGFSAQGGFYFQFNDLSNGAYSFNQLDDLAKQQILAGTASGFFSSLYTQFIPSAPAFSLKIDRSILGALNVDFQQAMKTIAVLAGSNYSGLTYESGQVRNIYVQADARNRSSLEDVLGYYVRSRDDKMVQVSEFATADLSSAPPVISHYNLYRTILIQGAEAIGKSSGQALTKIQEIFKAQDFNNIGYAFTGLASLQLSAGNASVLVFGLGILVVYLVLSAQYESYVTPVIILMTVPLAMLGALVFLALRSIDLNIYAQVGLVTLIGLAAKNGILIVEVAEQHMEAGMTAAEAAIASAESRLRPILMTAIAALAGFLPLVVATTAGANSQQSLGTVIFGGLLVATVLSLGVVPPFYVVVKGLEARWFGPDDSAPEPPALGAAE